MNRWWWRSVLVATAYVAAGRLGLALDSPSPFVSVFWPALGGALAVLVRWGPGTVPALLAGAVALQLSVGAPLALAIGIALGNVGGPWAASRWLLRAGFNPQLTQRRDLWLLLGAGGLGATACTALNGASWLAATGRIASHDWPVTVLQWWAGDTLGLLVAGVPLLTLSRRSLASAFGPQRRHLSLALLAGAGVLLAASVVTTPWLGLGALAVLLAPPVLLCGVAMRAGLATASAAVLAGSLAMVAATAAGLGPFAQVDTLQPGIPLEELKQRLPNLSGMPKREFEHFIRQYETLGSPPDLVKYPVQVWRIGTDFQFIALTGETVVDYSLKFKAAYGWNNTWVCGYNNDLTSYVPSLRVLKEGGYEGVTGMFEYGHRAPYTETVEERITAKVEELMKQTK